MGRGQLAVSVLTLLAVVSPLLAQTSPVRVRATDFGGTPVTEAEVSVLDADGKVVKTSLSDSTGDVVFQGLPSGENKFVASAGDLQKLQLVVKLEEEALKVQTGSARVHVLDASGSPLANVNVFLLGFDRGFYATDSAGEVVFKDVPVGRRDFQIKATGFMSELFIRYYVTADKDLNIRAVLQSLQETRALPELPPIPARKLHVPGLKE